MSSSTEGFFLRILLYLLILSSLFLSTESTAICHEVSDTSNATKSPITKPVRERHTTKTTKKKFSSDSATSGSGSENLSPVEHNNRAVELGSKGLWQDAIREHEIALNGDPENQMFRTNLSSAHLHYADLLANKRKWYEAILHYREALYADPNNIPADHHLDTRALGPFEPLLPGLECDANA